MDDLWLERELARQLAPVIAPESLWERINEPQRIPRRRMPLDRTFWPVAIAMVLLAFAGVMRTLAIDRNTAGALAFRSGNFEDIRAWAKAEANIEIDLPAGQSAAGRSDVTLLGARLIRLNGLPTAAVDYRVGDEAATLFVSGKHGGTAEASGHLFTGTNTRLFSWNMKNQTYTIAFSGVKDPRGACLLCHRS
jgi:anti-sigma factor RsiW